MTSAALALDDRAEWESFSSELPARHGCWESWLAIEGMHCPACSLTIEEVVGALPGVAEVQVNGATAMARVVWSPGPARPSQWIEALAVAGYGALPAADARDAARGGQRTLLWRWLVAGFCMMQVMMYAVPAYIAMPGEITPDQQALLRWAAWILTLPVLLFSCRPFFSSAWRDLRAGSIGMDVPVALGIAIAFGASSAATFDPAGPLGGDVWFDSLTMFVFFLLSGRLLEQRLRTRTVGALHAAMRRLPQTVTREREDGSTEIIPVRRLAVGDLILVKPGEAIPADGTITSGATQVDEALLTGESTPLVRGPGEAVLAGSHNLGGAIRVRVERVGAGTRHGEIVNLMERASVQKPALARLADRFARPFLVAVLLAAAMAAAAWWPLGPAHALAIAIAVLIVTCPCALSLATPAATLAAAGALARKGVLVRNIEALETAAAIDTVVFDKTGTLTADTLELASVSTRRGITSGQALRWAGALACHSLHPAARAIAALQRDIPDAQGVEELAGQGLRGAIDGLQLRLGSAAFTGTCETARLQLADADGWLASFELRETLRDDAAATITALRKAGVHVELLSGDRHEEVGQLAQRLGITRHEGGQSPEDKLRRIAALQRAGHRVAMVGDGMNDGPVLARADVSIAMGHAVPIAQSRCDFILQGSQLSVVPMLFAHAKRTRRTVRQNIAWAALYNAACVPLALAGFMPPWLAGIGMAASSLAVVANAARLSRT
jgi:Cu2+-exporting ATPase